jgi:hypothetical protein
VEVKLSWRVGAGRRGGGGSVRRNLNWGSEIGERGKGKAQDGPENDPDGVLRDYVRGPICQDRMWRMPCGQIGYGIH